MLFLKLLVLVPAFILLLIAAPFLHIFSQILLIRWRYRNIPSPKASSFLLGHAKDLLDMETKGGHYSMLVVDWSKRYGTIFVLFIVNNATVICLEPDIVKRQTKSVFKPFKTLFGERFLGDGLFTQLSNSKWAEQRKALNPAFKRRYLMDLMTQYNGSCRELITFLKPKADGKTKVLMAKELNKVTLDIVAKVAFDMKDLHVIAEEDTTFCLAAEKGLYGVMVQYKLSFFGQIDPRPESRRMRADIRKSTKLVRDVGRKCIRKRFQDMNDGKEYPRDILTQLLKTYVTGHEIKDEEMVLMLDEFATFIVAGQETTTHLMAFTLEYVGRHPEIYRKIQDEIDKVIGDNDFITYNDIGKLEYLNLVVKESLRVAPPVTVIHRLNTEELVVNGVKIPAGTDIELNNYALSRDERFWDEPEKFNPERFRNDSSRNFFAYFPFSMGPRICIGQHFALIEGKVMLAKLFQNFNFTLVNPGEELRYCYAGTLKPLDKTPVYLTRRKLIKDTN